MLLAAITRHRIQQHKTHIYAKHRCPVNRRPNRPILGKHDLNRQCRTGLRSQHRLPRNPGAQTPASLNQLHPTIQPVPRCLHILQPCHRQTKHQVFALNNRRHHRQSKPRERLKPKRLRRMLPPQRMEPVLRRHKQVLPRDPGRVIKWRPMRLHLPGILIPNLLHRMRHLPPCGQRPPVHLQMLQLRRAPREPDRRPLHQKRPSLYMPCRDVPGRAEDITDKDIRTKPHHGHTHLTGTTDRKGTRQGTL